MGVKSLYHSHEKSHKSLFVFSVRYQGVLFPELSYLSVLKDLGENLDLDIAISTFLFDPKVTLGR